MKTISIFLALINSLFAGFLIALNLSYEGMQQGILWSSLIKLSVESLTILIGVATWMGVMGSIQPGPVLLGNVFLIALGPVTIMWTLHVALTSGGMEYHMAIYGGSLMMQGMSSLLGFGSESRKITIS